MGRSQGKAEIDLIGITEWHSQQIESPTDRTDRLPNRDGEVVNSRRLILDVPLCRGPVFGLPVVKGDAGAATCFDLSLCRFRMEKCESLGAHLLEIETLEERAAVYKYIEEDKIPNQDIYLGATDRLEDGAWVWNTTGDRVKTANWLKGQPSDWAHEENCAVISWGFGKKLEWDDLGCFGQRYYACEK
ncbi:hypothetical protein ScPMuIL_001764 [Solemya velum]